MTTLETLKAARLKIEDPKHWTKNAAAKYKNGKTAPSYHPKAYKFCAIGAITSTGAAPFSAACSAISAEMGGLAAFFNDTHTHAEVLRAFDAAIKKLEVA